MFCVVNVGFNYFPGDALCGLRIEHDSNNLQVIHWGGVLKTRRDKNLDESCHLLVLSPTSVVIATDCSDSFLKPGKSPFVVAVYDATFEHLIVVDAIRLYGIYLARIVL